MGKFDTQLNETRTERNTLIHEQRDIFAKSEKEKRALTPEEQEKFDKIDTDIAALDKRCTNLEKLNANETDDSGEPPVGADDEGASNRSRNPGEPPIGRDGGSYARDRRNAPHASREYRAAFGRYLATGETRDLVAGTTNSGGALLAPVQMSDEIIKSVEDDVFIRGLAKIFTLDSAQSVGVGSFTSRISDSDWVSEIGTLTPDTTAATARRLLTPMLVAKLALVSIRAEMSGVDFQGEVSEQLAYKNAITEERGFTLGSGSNQALGVYTASANGVPTSQDVTSTATASFTGDDFITLKYSLKGKYTSDPKKSRWLLNRTILGKVRALKDSSGRYLWREGISADKPDTLLDVAVCMSEYAPAVMTTGSYVALIGHFGYYGIAQVKDFWIQRLTEKYADTSEIGYIGRRFVDGQPLLGEAFARLKTA